MKSKNKTILSCPCEREVEFKLENGIIVYRHIDGDSSCKLLNKFYQDKCLNYVWERVRYSIENNDPNMFNIYMCINSHYVFDKISEWLILQNTKMTLQFFTMICKQDSDVSDNLVKEIKVKLINRFGEVATRNISAFNINNNYFITQNDKRIKQTSIKTIKDISKLVQNKTSYIKEDIVNDLAKSMFLEKEIKSSLLLNSLKNIIKTP